MPEQKHKKLPALFYRTAAGREPVREWLKNLPVEDRRILGTDIATVEFGWPVGMPVCRLTTGRRGLFEVRSSLTGNRIARVLFCIQANGAAARLHQEDRPDTGHRLGPGDETEEGA